MSIRLFTRSFSLPQSRTLYNKFPPPQFLQQIGKSQLVPHTAIRLSSTGSSNPIDLIQDASLLETATRSSDLASLGLGGYMPPGILQTILDTLHTNVGLPWWGAIVLTTIFLRSLMFPFTIRSMRASQRTMVVQPQLLEVQAALKKATGNGDEMEAERMTTKYLTLLKKNDITPLKQFTNVLVQAPVFISFFIALRQMYNAPVESMSTGGLMWFSNLLIPDPFYILPACTSSTLLISLFVSEARSAMQASPIVKYGLIGMACVLFPITIKFPACLTLYWLTSNVFTTAVSLTITHERFAPYFGLKTSREINQMLSSRPKGKRLMESITENYKNIRANSKYRAMQQERIREVKLAEKEKTIKIVIPAENIEKSYKKLAQKTRPFY